MTRIFPHLWFDTEAVAAAEFYTTVFKDTRITMKSVLKNTPSGDCDIVSVAVRGIPLMAISAGPYFTINPSISFMVNFDPSRESDAREQLDAAWAALIEGGKALMDIGEYPFSKRYGWVQDKYGVSWQLILTNPEGEPRPTVVPSLLFTQDKCGKAKEAIDYYTSVFKDSQKGAFVPYGPGMAPEKEGNVMFADFRLLETWFAAMESAREHEFTFNEGVSLMVRCQDQAEIDYYWSKLSAVPEAEQCGWCKDKFGVSWQVTPADMDAMMSTADKAALQRVVKAFLPMKKFDLAALTKAFEGK
jgi:predicted 3-demethylubiquinone-9 3-methyltransferase (glyoxalase superfamily)